jgi:hypothetical protein
MFLIAFTAILSACGAQVPVTLEPSISTNVLETAVEIACIAVLA